MRSRMASPARCRQQRCPEDDPRRSAFDTCRAVVSFAATGARNGALRREALLAPFIVKTDAELEQLLPSAKVSFVDLNGNHSTADSGELVTLVNGGGGTHAMHSFSRSFNDFGGGAAMTVAFEDTSLESGDFDYQDVVFTMDLIV